MKFDNGDWFGVFWFSVKWFFIWSFRGLVVLSGFFLVIFALMALGMSQANRDGTVRKDR